MRKRGPSRSAGEGSTFIHNALSLVSVYHNIQARGNLMAGRESSHPGDSEGPRSCTSPGTKSVQVSLMLTWILIDRCAWGETVQILGMHQLQFIFYTNKQAFCCQVPCISLDRVSRSLRTSQERVSELCLFQRATSPFTPQFQPSYSSLIFPSELPISMEQKARFCYWETLERPRSWGRRTHAEWARCGVLGKQPGIS